MNGCLATLRNDSRLQKRLHAEGLIHEVTVRLFWSFWKMPSSGESSEGNPVLGGTDTLSAVSFLEMPKDSIAGTGIEVCKIG